MNNCERQKKFYDKNKSTCVRMKILQQIERKGSIPTKSSVEKYSITFTEIMRNYETYLKTNEVCNKTVLKLGKRMQEVLCT